MLYLGVEIVTSKWKNLTVTIINEMLSADEPLPPPLGNSEML